MLSLDRARMVADYLRARAEVRRASLGTPAALAVAAFLALRVDASSPWTSHAWLAAALLLGPWLLRAVPLPGALSIYRLELAAFPLNALLLGFILFREAGCVPALEVEGLPALRWLYPALAFIAPAVYLAVGAADWLRRMRLSAWIRGTLAVPPVAGYLEEPEALLAQALSRAPRRADAWAQFRTVPASARNLKLFLQLDTARHGTWRVAFADGYALVAFQDGTGCEAVEPGGIHLAAGLAAPGERERLILIRWNAHFHEGRALPDDQLKMQAWNSRSAGYEPKSTVPAPF